MFVFASGSFCRDPTMFCGYCKLAADGQAVIRLGCARHISSKSCASNALAKQNEAMSGSTAKTTFYVPQLKVKACSQEGLVLLGCALGAGISMLWLGFLGPSNIQAPFFLGSGRLPSRSRSSCSVQGGASLPHLV